MAPEGLQVSKKRKAFIPQFGAPQKRGAPLKPGQVVAQQSAPPTAPKIKPQAIPMKSSGHRGA
jgi:hypothetical protein